MNPITAKPRSPYLLAYAALLPGCVLGGLGLLAYSLLAGPGKVDFAGILIAAVLVFVWCGYAFAVGVILVSIYAVPMIWLFGRIGIPGPIPIMLMSVLPGTALLLLGAAEYRKFSWFLLGFGVSVGLSYCLLAYRKAEPAG